MQRSLLPVGPEVHVEEVEHLALIDIHAARVLMRLIVIDYALVALVVHRGTLEVR